MSAFTAIWNLFFFVIKISPWFAGSSNGVDLGRTSRCDYFDDLTYIISGLTFPFSPFSGVLLALFPVISQV
jgi:hypothetical protein